MTSAIAANAQITAQAVTVSGTMNGKKIGIHESSMDVAPATVSALAIV